MALPRSPAFRTVAVSAGIAVAAVLLILRWNAVVDGTDEAAAREGGRTLAALQTVVASTPPDSLHTAGTAAAVSRLFHIRPGRVELSIHRLDAQDAAFWGDTLPGRPPLATFVDSLSQSPGMLWAADVGDGLVAAGMPAEIGGALPGAPPAPAMLVYRADLGPLRESAARGFLLELGAAAALLIPLLLLLSHSRRESAAPTAGGPGADGERTFTIRRPHRGQLEQVMASLRKAEEQLEEQSRLNTLRSREQIRALDGIDEGIIFADRSGRITGLNAAATRLFALDRGDAPPADLRSLFGSEEVAEAVSGTVDAGHVSGLSLVHHRVPGGDGKPLDLEIASRRLPDGSILGVVRSAEKPRDAVAEQGTLLRLLLHASPLGVVGCEETAIRFVNRAAEEITGRAAADLEGRDLAELFHPDERDRVRGYLAGPSAAGGTALHRDMRVLTAAGGVRHVDLGIAAAALEGRQLFTCTLADRTEEQRLRESAAEAERSRDALLAATPDGILVVDRGVIVAANPAAAGLLGAGGPAALLDTPANRLLHPDNRATLVGLMREVLSSGGSTMPTPARLTRLDGGTVDADLSLHAVTHAGRPALQMVARDRTAARNAERRLRTDQAYMESALEHLPFACWIADREGRLLYQNARSVALNGSRVGGTFLDEPDATMPGKALYEATLRAIHGEPGALPNGIVGTPHGATRLIPLTVDGVVTSVMGVETPAAGVPGREPEHMNAELERRVAERTAEYESALRELEAFTYSVSHDLRAPLRAIEGFTRILAEEHAGRLDADGLQVLAVVGESAQHMTRLIDDLLMLSRVGTSDLDRTPIDMTALFRSVADEFAPGIATAPGFSLTIDPLPSANGDLRMIRQVAVNLLSNAVKFSRTRHTPEVEVGSFTGADGKPVYYVQDNGVGFDPRQVQKLFKVFQRLHSADQFEGTGVGLAIVERIITRHGGRVWAEGKPGRGATFFFSW